MKPQVYFPEIYSESDESQKTVVTPKKKLPNE